MARKDGGLKGLENISASRRSARWHRVGDDAKLAAKRKAGAAVEISVVSLVQRCLLLHEPPPVDCNFG